MGDYIDIMKKYRIIIVLYIIVFIVIIYFIWKPKSAVKTSMFDVTKVDENQVYEYYYSYYKGKLDKVFAEGNYEEIYNNYLLDDYKSKNSITLDNVEEILKDRCESFASSSTTKYTVNDTGNTIIYQVNYFNGDISNSMYIYEYSPYDFKIAFGKNVYSTDVKQEQDANNEDNSQNADNIIIDNKSNGLNFEIFKAKEYNDFVQYDVKVTNTQNSVYKINLIQNSSLVLVDPNNKYYMGSISNNDIISLEKDNYATFSVSFKINIDTLSTIKSLRFLKVEKNGEIEQVDVKIN